MDRVAQVMLAPNHVDEFNQFGLLKLKQCVDPATATKLSDRLWEFLESEREMSKNDPSSWMPGHRPTGFQKLSRKGTFKRMASSRLRNAVDELLDGPVSHDIKNWGIPLLVFPDPSVVPRTVPFGPDTWHIDAPPRTSSCTAIRAFLLLEDVARDQGPTFAVAGSSRLMRQLMTKHNSNSRSSKTILKQLSKSEPWINRLLAEPHPVVRDNLHCWGKSMSGLPLRVTQFVGEAGDVFLMDISSLHSKSVNTSRLVRMVVSQTFWKK